MGDSLPLLLKLLLVQLVMRTEMLACLWTYLHYIGKPGAPNQIYTPKHARYSEILPRSRCSPYQTLILVIKARIKRGALLTFIWLLRCSMVWSSTTRVGGSALIFGSWSQVSSNGTCWGAEGGSVLEASFFSSDARVSIWSHISY